MYVYMYTWMVEDPLVGIGSIKAEQVESLGWTQLDNKF